MKCRIHTVKLYFCVIIVFLRRKAIFDDDYDMNKKKIQCPRKYYYTYSKLGSIIISNCPTRRTFKISEITF